MRALQTGAAILAAAMILGSASAQSQRETSSTQTPPAELPRSSQISRDQVERFNQRLLEYQHDQSILRRQEETSTSTAAQQSPEERRSVRYSAVRWCNVISYGATVPVPPETLPIDFGTVLLRLNCDTADAWGHQSFEFRYATTDEAGRTVASHFESVILAAIQSGRPIFISYREENRRGENHAHLTGVTVHLR